MRDKSDLLGGLSPRVRGNQSAVGTGGVGIGSIPACTGEPSVRDIGSGHGEVYPRVYGGTERMRQQVDGAHGLSPRVRGNRP